LCLADAYADALAELRPKNAHIPEKSANNSTPEFTRRLLAGDLKLLEFLSPGSYRLL
jgi:hypothetical protein